LDENPDSTGGLPSSSDLTEYFPAIDDQQDLNSATVHAAVALLQYFDRRAHGKIVQPSRLFLYQTTRRMLNATGRTDLSFRAVWKAITTFGAPPEKYWPYSMDALESLPDAFLYGFSQAYRDLRYVRVGGGKSRGKDILATIKALLAAGFPVAFGFGVPSSLTDDGDIPYRPKYDYVQGGHAVVAVGHDDRRLRPTRGALLIRNSWGETWGEGGYGWLPYAFVEKGLARDFWTVIRPDWLCSGEFWRPEFSA
jgi:C1A family cysteine protease